MTLKGKIQMALGWAAFIGALALLVCFDGGCSNPDLTVGELAEAVEDSVRAVAREEAVAVADQWMDRHLEVWHGQEAPTGPVGPTGPPAPTGPPGATGPTGPDPVHPADPCGTVSAVHSKPAPWMDTTAFTGSGSKLGRSGGLWTNEERNATAIPIVSLAGGDDCDRWLNIGRVRFAVTVNADGLETGGGGKHLVQLASTALSRAKRGLPTSRLEIANPGDGAPRFVYHGHGNGMSGSRELGKLPISFRPGVPVEIEWTWRCIGPDLEVTCCGGATTRRYGIRMGAEAECIGRYWSAGHMETPSGGGVFTFTKPVFDVDP